VSFVANARAATDFDVYYWNVVPSNIDRAYARLWDWRDVQFLRGIGSPLSLVPSLGWPETATASELAAAQAAGITFGDSLKLVGYDAKPDTVSPGQTATLALYWQADGPRRSEPSVTIQLLDRFGNAMAQDTFAPVQGYATNMWASGEVYVSRQELVVPPDAPTGMSPVEVSIRDGERGPTLAAQNATDSSGSACIASLAVGQPSLADPASLAASSKVDALFGDGIRLRGFSLPSPSLRPGQPIHLTLYWQSEQPMGQNYTVFVHVLDESGKLVAQQDNEPNGGLYPTGLWQVGQPVQDSYDVATPEGLPPGPYRIIVGMYEWPSLQRLAVTAQGETRGDSLTLTELTVER
jgi:hypothetical protein